MVIIKFINFIVCDGLVIYGYLIILNNVEEKNLLLVVMLYGGFYGFRDWWGYDLIV